MQTCGMSIIKYTLFLFNLVFAVSGIAIIAAGALVLTNVGQFNRFMETRIIAPPIVLIVAGTIVFIIAFLGCYGAIKENYNMLVAFAAALLIIFVIELAVGIAAAVFRDDFSTAMKDSLSESLYNNTEVDKEAWDSMQRELKCCGVDKSYEWYNAKGSRGIPSSCCIDDNSSSNSASDFCAGKVYTEGCYSKLEMRVKQGATVLIGVGIGIAFIEIFGIVLACCLATAIKKEHDK